MLVSVLPQKTKNTMNPNKHTIIGNRLHHFRAHAGIALALTTSIQAALYTDKADKTNPTWETLVKTLPSGSNYGGPVNGSTIDVNNAAVESGWGTRDFASGFRLHVCCNSSTTNLTGFSRWYQKDSKTQVFRLFKNDQNTTNDRVTSRCEAFNTEYSWNYNDKVRKTYIWTGHYTVAKRPAGDEFAIFQAKNDTYDWSVQLYVNSSGQLLVRKRRVGDVVAIDNVDGQQFDTTIYDDGYNYKVMVNGKLIAQGSYSRPSDITRFRWGMYYGAAVPSAQAIILVSGAQVSSTTGGLSGPRKMSATGSSAHSRMLRQMLDDDPGH